MEARIDAAEKKLDDREAHSVPMPAGVALGFGGCLMVVMAFVLAAFLPVLLGRGHLGLETAV